MPEHPRGVDEMIARFHEVSDRMDRIATAKGPAPRRAESRSAQMRKLVNIGIALAVLIAATIVFGLLGQIGLLGLFAIGALMFLAVLFFSVWSPGERPAAVYKEDMPNKAVVQRLDSLLHSKRRALPSPAAARLDAIGAQLPLLESRLAEADILDPLAQDARRLMGRHLPELLERYERVPAAYRQERDGEGMTVDERLVAGLDAARAALDDLGRKLAHEDLTAFETQGRFIETRYKDDQDLQGN